MWLFLFLIPFIATACPLGFCTQGSSCIQSTPGALCRECNSQGFVSNGTCVCILPYADPTLNCTQVISYASVHTVTAVASQVTCLAFQNTAEGFYLQPDYSRFTFGTPNPPMPDTCLNAAFGPQPNQISDALLTGVPIQTCNTLGGADPNLVASANDTSFATCSSHGLWNIAPVYRCSCYQGWGLADTGIPTFAGETAKTCSVCAPFFGPPPISRYYPGPFCASIWTPNNVTGENAVCGGRGVMSPTGCACYANNGTLTIVTGTFGVLQYSGPTGNNVTLTSVTVNATTCV